MNKEILSVIESISNEKSLDKNIVFSILENALENSIKSKINKKINIKVLFNKITGEFSVFKLFKIVNIVINKDNEISLEECKKKKLDLYLNKYAKEEITEFTLDRISSKIAKQIIFSKIKKIEKISLIKNFKSLIGNIFIGIIKRIYENKIILDIGYDIEAVLNKNHMLFNDIYKLEKKIKVILYNIKYNEYELQLLVSRSHIYMLLKLVKNNVPYINKNKLKIKYIARNPGIRTKIVVENINNINTYILFNNINNIYYDLNNEKVDIILWNNNIIKFIENIIFPIKAKYIKIDNNKNHIFLYIKKYDLFNILGKNNSNIKLIYKLIDKTISINTI